MSLFDGAGEVPFFVAKSLSIPKCKALAQGNAEDNENRFFPKNFTSLKLKNILY